MLVCFPKGKNPIIINRGSGYVTTPNPSDIDDMVCYNVEKSYWDLDRNLRVISKMLAANITSASQNLVKNDELTCP